MTSTIADVKVSTVISCSSNETGSLFGCCVITFECWYGFATNDGAVAVGAGAVGGQARARMTLSRSISSTWSMIVVYICVMVFIINGSMFEPVFAL